VQILDSAGSTLPVMHWIQKIRQEVISSYLLWDCCHEYGYCVCRG